MHRGKRSTFERSGCGAPGAGDQGHSSRWVSGAVCGTLGKRRRAHPSLSLLELAERRWCGPFVSRCPPTAGTAYESGRASQSCTSSMVHSAVKPGSAAAHSSAVTCSSVAANRSSVPMSVLPPTVTVRFGL